MKASARRRSALALVPGLALVALLAYSVLGRGTDAAPERAPGFSLDMLERGTPAPQFRLAAGDGRISLDELRGSPVVLNFWASWCEYCRNETPMLEATWKRVAGDGVLVLGVDTKDVDADARAFLDEHGVTYPSVRDPDEVLADRYRATGLPATYFINARGEIVDQFIGELSAEDVEAGIRAARAG